MNLRILQASALAALALLAAGCAAPPAPPPAGPTTRVVLLPQEDGSPSAVVLRSGNAQQRIDTPYGQASAAAGQAPQMQQLEAGAVRQGYAPLFTSAPPKSQRFVVYFLTGTTKLAPESARTIGNVLDAATQFPGGEILIIGHTDTLGANELNDTLSLRRAGEVRDMFIARRFPASRLEAAGRGEREPAVATRDNTAEQRNRRVEIIVR